MNVSIIFPLDFLQNISAITFITPFNFTIDLPITWYIFSYSLLILLLSAIFNMNAMSLCDVSRPILQCWFIVECQIMCLVYLENVQGHLHTLLLVCSFCLEFSIRIMLWLWGSFQSQGRYCESCNHSMPKQASSKNFSGSGTSEVQISSSECSYNLSMTSIIQELFQKLCT